MPLLGPAQRAPNWFLRLWVSTTTADPVIQGAFGLTYTEVKYVTKLGRGNVRTYDTLEVTTNTDDGAKSHIKGMFQSEGVSSIEIQVVGTDPGFVILDQMSREAQIPRVIKYQPSGDYATEREEYHYALVTGITYDQGDIGGSITATVSLQCTGKSMERARP
jgi:hypothetical protein